MKRKLSNQFLANFLVVFLLTILTTALAFGLLSFASGLIADTLSKNQYPASALIQEDYTKIDTSGVVQNGGGVQVVDKDYRVVYTKGLNTIGKEKLSAGEFTAFLLQSKDKPYHYDILYQAQGEFWLIVTFPTSLRLDFAVVSNKDASSGDTLRASWVLASVALVYLLMLALFTLIYSRITAASITVPLRKLSDGTRLLREGDYSARVDLRLDNEFLALQNTFNDMAARIEHEIMLRKKSENDRRRLILDISHDLKNPMSSIQGYAELCLKNSGISPKEQDEYLKIILQNSERANRLLNELFVLSQMDSPDFELKPIKTDLCEFLRQECGELIPELERSGFSYTFDIPEQSVFVRLDPDRFGRMMQNLWENALRHNPCGTTLSVRLKVQDRQAVVEVQDDGYGIPQQLKEEIFKPFVRADHFRNHDTGGSGLGLSIAKKIAIAHGGDITLQDDGQKGSTFRITVPRIV